ncbi:MAG: T9SS type A sorting domain-containing protein [Prevotella sp.]|jgi:hypothetical protein|nr:T9SS type A sorting domain-containing protein [Prevotella sp.]
MKHRKDFLISLALVALALFSSYASYGQITSFTATYDFPNNAAPMSAGKYVWGYNGTSYTGISPDTVRLSLGNIINAATNAFVYNTWTSSPTIIDTQYIYFTIHANIGYKFTIDSILFNIHRLEYLDNSTGNTYGMKKCEWRGSHDLYTTTLNNYTSLDPRITHNNGVIDMPITATSITPTTVFAGNVLAGGNNYTNITTSASFRFYFYDASQTSFKRAGLEDSITIYGKYEPVSSTAGYTVFFSAGNPAVSNPANIAEQTPSAGIVLPSVSIKQLYLDSGWTFAGWTIAAVAPTATPPTPLLAAGSAYNPASQGITLYAVYLKSGEYNSNPYIAPPAVPYTVSFNSGIAAVSNPPNITETVSGAGITLPNVTLKPDYSNQGWTIAGWAIAAVNTPTAIPPTLYLVNATYNPVYNLTLYAVYVKSGLYTSNPQLSRYTVSFNTGSAAVSTPADTTQTAVGASITLPNITVRQEYINENWTFAGWSEGAITATSTTPSPLYNANASYTPTSDTTLYAVYLNSVTGIYNTYPQLTPYTVTFSVEEAATSTPGNETETSIGAGITLPSITLKQEYTNESWAFAGWSESVITLTNTAPAPLYAAGSTYYPLLDNITLYAVYVKTVPTSNLFYNSDPQLCTPIVVSGAANQSICLGTALDLITVTGGLSPWVITYNTNKQLVIHSSPCRFTASAEGDTTFYLHNIIDANGCGNVLTDIITITVLPVPTVSLTANQTIALGDSIENLMTLTGIPPWEVTYYNGSSNQTLPIDKSPYVYVPLSTGIYTFSLVSVRDASGCTNNSLNGSVVITVTPALSNDASLKILSVSEGSLTPVFNKNTFTYHVNVSSNVDSITLSAQASDNNATIRGLGRFPLVVGANPFAVEVTAKNGITKQTYTVTVNKASVGIMAIHSEMITLYPNPTKEALQIVSPLPIRQINIYDVSGKMVKQIINPEQSISVSELTSGMYLLQIHTTKGIIDKRIKKE